jgi:VanZ like family
MDFFFWMVLMIKAWWIIAVIWLGVIYYFGQAGFGRANSQALIDKLKKYPRLWLFFDRQHGNIRASFHYIEFGICYAVIFFTVCLGNLQWHYGKAFLAWFITCFLAFLDEMHQKGSGGRCFRRIDLLHSMLGASIVMLLFFILY